MLNAETRVSGEELLERFTLMSGGVIQEDDDGAAQVPQQCTQKRTDFLLETSIAWLDKRSGNSQQWSLPDRAAPEKRHFFANCSQGSVCAP
jgi:hypothetical protein